MTSKREKLQYAYVFFADLLTMAVSVLLAWLITDGLFGVLIPYTSTDWLQTLCLLFVAFVVTFFFFDQDKNIVTRSENEEISLSLRFNIALGLVYAGCMLLAKATMLDSRYFAVTVPAVNAVLLPFSHAILKRLLIRFQRSWGMETLVGVVTTSDRAERLISEIQKDWSRRVVGVSLLEATPAAISTRVCGVEVKATFQEDNSVLNVFYDVPNDAYYFEAVKWAVGKNITNGVSENLFGPDQACTRAQIVTFLWRAAGSPVVNYAMDLTDVPADAYYAEAVRWALSEGITTGTGEGTFSPDAACTRAQAVTFLARALDGKTEGAANFQDVLAGSYYAEAVAWAVEGGITQGVGGDRFDPNATCTRAQIATFLARSMK